MRQCDSLYEECLSTMLQRNVNNHPSLSILNTLLHKSISYFIPSTCLLCGMEGEHLVCSACTEQFFSAKPKRCISCAHPVLIYDTHCGNCLKNPPTFHTTLVACDYTAPLDQLILELKFGHRLAIAPTLGTLLAKAVSSATTESTLPDFFIPVPLSRQRLAKRGFNQSLEIAKPVAHILNRPIHPNLLCRVRDTEAQTLLHPDERYENIRHAFSIPNQSYEHHRESTDKIRGRHIGVVDDVMTTGATLNEVASCLLHYGAARVSNIVFARTPPH